ncbi:DUF952 domain-containing protein [Rhizomonospora bruguierae]|uniref:DUF952 domain-containing protein n=1 Tax=Rhizomonospora bruguierae TaxID=1581705 RepID=UPI001BCAB0CA|nr:DUF952 domain-containing protein [Micromonospora sp. NBRC 107566]
MIYKILAREEWAAALAAGRYDGSAADLRDGFVHLSCVEQVTETAERHFAGQSGLLLLAVAEERLGAALRWEPSRGGALFPHVYGPLPLDAVVAAAPMPDVVPPAEAAAAALAALPATP